MSPEEALRRVFGHGGFRPGQREVVEKLLEGRSVLAVFPTGGGKSLCYQLPALLWEGMTVVISPLIALMTDQVLGLQARGVAAARLDSSLSASETRELEGALERGEIRLLFVAPERAGRERLTGLLSKLRVALVAVDEAHCISEWGHNFRPDYLKLGSLAERIGAERVLALTATATPQVARDIRERLGIAAEDEVATGFRRPNLRFARRHCTEATRDAALVKCLRRRRALPAIVYVTFQQTAEVVAGHLIREGFGARAYHAGLPSELREETQARFMAGQTEVVVATIAFGMGIDKADIRSVIHYNLPKSLENYVQESGRAGRDGKVACCEVLACGADVIPLQNFAYGNTPARSSLKSLVERLLLRKGRFDVSLYELGALHDMRSAVLETLLTELELREILRTAGTFYADYKVQWDGSWERVVAGRQGGERRILDGLGRVAKRGRLWWTVDVEAVAEAAGVEPEAVRALLHTLEEGKEAVLQPSRVRHAYERLERDASPGVLAAELQELLEAREAAELERLSRVVDYCEAPGCLAQRLAAYFGEEDGEPCGVCSECRRGAVERLKLAGGEAPQVSDADVVLIHQVVRERHAALRHPRQVARFLCGMSSPASTRARLTRRDAFGALQHLPFPEVLFQAETLMGSP